MAILQRLMFWKKLKVPVHICNLVMLGEYRPAPTGPPPFHTAFFVLQCDCGMVNVFPESNYALTTPEFKEFFAAELAGHGAFLVLTDE